MLNTIDKWSQSLEKLIEESWLGIGFVKEVNSDGSILYSIKKNCIEFWITSYDSEFTIGLNNSTNECTWHTHMSLFGANTIDEQLCELNKQIDRIINNKVRIVFSSEKVMWLFDESQEKYMDEDKYLNYKYWKEF